jgi:cardiolipin synthase
VHNGNAAYAAMISAIEEAERYVVLCSYIFRSDEAGMPVIEALLRAHQRGVEVRVLLDGIGAGYFRSPTVVAVEIAEVKNVNGDGATG